MKYDALIFWGIDWDKLAAAVGKHLEKNPPPGCKVIEYTGNKDWPGIHRKDIEEKFMYPDEAHKFLHPDKTRDQYSDLEDMFLKKQIVPAIREYLKQYRPFFSLELHSTRVRDLNNILLVYTKRLYLRKTKISIHAGSSNNKGAQFFLDNYVRKKIEWPIGLPTPYPADFHHHYAVEIYHAEKNSHVDKSIIEGGAFEICDLVRFMLKCYPTCRKYNMTQ